MTTNGKAYSNTQGGMLRRPGIRSGTGTFNAGGASLQVFPGDTFRFVGFTGPADAYTPGSEGETYECLAIVQSVTVTINWVTRDIISYVVNFQTVGEVVESTGAYSDLTYPDAPSASAASVKVVGVDGSDSGSDAGSGEEVSLCVETLTLTLTAANVTYANSCTGGWMEAKPGNLDWNVSMVLPESSLAAMPYAAGDFVHLRIYVDETRYWDLKWGIAAGFSNFVVNRQTSEIETWTSVLQMTSHTLDPADGIGHVRVPGHPDEDWWPRGETGLELVLNSSFDDGADYWEQLAGSATFNVGDVDLATDGSAGAAGQRVWLEAGKTYKVVTVTSSVLTEDATVQLEFDPGGTPTVAVHTHTAGAPGTKSTDVLITTTGWYYIVLLSNTGGTATFDSASIKVYN